MNSSFQKTSDRDNLLSGYAQKVMHELKVGEAQTNQSATKKST